MQLNRTSVLIAPVLILLLFAPSLAGIERLAFRDVSHFYTPLYDYVASRCSQQWLPLWNPLDQTGVPLAGETTTAVFYPPRYVLFMLPIASEVAISWYVALHLILASLTAWIAARWAGLDQPASTLVSVLYPLSGSIVFLYTNPPYLVGAAWLPLALGASLARHPPAQRTLVAGTAMSMMLLGGDPQTALHAMIIASLVWAVQFLRRKRSVVTCSVLVAAPILAAALAAPQLAASISWSSQSERIRAGDQDGWADPPIVGSRRHESFQYSLAPWHALELVTPNAFGGMFPVNARISRLIPGDGRTWTPTIYTGILVLLAIMAGLGWPHPHRIDMWLVIALASLWLSMGQFGVVWLIQATTHTLPGYDSAVGGPYWWLYQFVPGYDSFRYPAKWLSVFSLAASISAARSIEQSWFERDFWKQRLRPLTLVLGAMLVTALLLILLLRWKPTFALDAAAKLPNDEFWGPFDIPTAFAQINRSVIHSIIALVAVAGVFRLQVTRRWGQPTAMLALAVIAGVDMSMCGREMIASVSRRQEQVLIEQVGRSIQPHHSRWMRTQTGGGWPDTWRQTRDEHRIIDVEASVRAAWFGRWHLEHRVSVFNNMLSIQSRSAAIFWKSTHKVSAGMTEHERHQFWTSIRRWLAIEGIVHTTAKTTEVLVDGRTALLVDRDEFFRAAGQRLRFHPNWTHDPTLEKSFVPRLRAIAGSAGLGAPAVQVKETDIAPSATNHRTATIEPIARQAEREEFVVHMNTAGLLTRPVLQDGHWVAEYSPANASRWQETPVHRVDLLTQGVLLPEGQWKLRFRYSPWWLSWSIAVACVAWVFVIRQSISATRTSSCGA